MNSPSYALQEKLIALDTALDAASPTMKGLLQDIHNNIKQDPEQVTLLSEEDISILVRGLKKQTATEITTTALKSKSSTKALKNVTLADL